MLPKTARSGRKLLRRFAAEAIDIYPTPTRPGNGFSRVDLDRLLDDQFVTVGEHARGLGRRVRVTELGHAVLTAHSEAADHG
ncbi:hypothetical protein D5S18_24870 [Nocardia panacis]|uniref:LysR family transcriptional regulator n=1 Tax=Nocardia panacis TaxID=2340916 RepID=A0A3A4JQA6_9NOCA|nr:hypothetical protein [Nocardia panacis]RJO71407.1 hypothetical protein D5S18_24870 [Nocardia panacis]